MPSKRPGRPPDGTSKRKRSTTDLDAPKLPAPLWWKQLAKRRLKEHPEYNSEAKLAKQIGGKQSGVWFALNEQDSSTYVEPISKALGIPVPRPPASEELAAFYEAIDALDPEMRSYVLAVGRRALEAARVAPPAAPTETDDEAKKR